MEVPVSADASKGPASPRSAMQRQSAGSVGSGRVSGRRNSAEIGPAGGGAPEERVSMTLQRISIQAPGAEAMGWG